MPDGPDSQTADHVMRNVVKIFDQNSIFYGSGFIIEVNSEKYCITCHHCIYEMEEIFIQTSSDVGDNSKKYSVAWNKELSDPSRDLAVLEFKHGPPADPLQCNPLALRGLPVTLFAYAEDELTNIPNGRVTENLSLSVTLTLFHWPQEEATGSNEWNQKPEVKVNVFGLPGSFSEGQSGSPVCYKIDNNVIGIFTAKIEDRLGFVIPIQTLLEKFRVDQETAQQSRNNSDYRPVDIAAIIESGNQMASNKMFNEAIGEFDRIIYDTNYVNALFNKAYALTELQKPADAIFWYDKVLDLYPDDVSTLGNKALILAQLGRYEDAVKIYEKALTTSPNDIDILTNMGLALDALDRFDEAIMCYDKLLAINPNDVRTLGNKGLALDNLKRYDEAMKLYDMALTIQPDRVNVISLKALLLSKMGKSEEVKKYIDMISKLKPDHVNSLRNIGVALYHLRKYDESLSWYDRALAIDPNDLNALAYKGEVLTILGKYNEAIDLFDKALAINPNHEYSSYYKKIAIKELEKARKGKRNLKS